MTRQVLPHHLLLETRTTLAFDTFHQLFTCPADVFQRRGMLEFLGLPLGDSESTVALLPISLAPLFVASPAWRTIMNHKSSLVTLTLVRSQRRDSNSMLSLGECIGLNGSQDVT